MRLIQYYLFVLSRGMLFYINFTLSANENFTGLEKQTGKKASVINTPIEHYFPILLAYLLLTGLTIVYCILLWYGAALWWIFINNSDFGSLHLVSRIFLVPLPLPILWQMIHWQSLAIISLLFCMIWGIKRSHRQNKESAYWLPITTHILWILFAICTHLLAAMLPLLSIGHMI